MELGNIQVMGIENMPKDKIFLGKVIDIKIDFPEIIMKFDVVGTMANFVMEDKSNHKDRE